MYDLINYLDTISSTNATTNNNPSLSLQIPYFLLSFPCIYPLYPLKALFQSSKLYGQSSSNVLNISL